jgi:hypothetical protein
MRFHVRDAFPRRPPTRAMAALGVLIADARHLHLTPDPRLAAMQREQNPHQLFEIDSVGLDPPPTPLHLDARDIEDLVFYLVQLSQRSSQKPS